MGSILWVLLWESCESGVIAATRDTFMVPRIRFFIVSNASVCVVYMHIHVGICEHGMCLHMHVYVWVWRPEFSMGCLLQFPPYVLRHDLSLDQKLLKSAVLTSQQVLEVLLSPTQPWVTDPLLCQAPTKALGIWTLVLVIVQQARCSLSYLHSSTSLPSLQCNPPSSDFHATI